jgi:hypothetical protein
MKKKFGGWKKFPSIATTHLGVGKERTHHPIET